MTDCGAAHPELLLYLLYLRRISDAIRARMPGASVPFRLCQSQILAGSEPVV